MYPYLRVMKELYKAGKCAPLPIHGMHESQHICWPVDIDAYLEMNNGRVLTLYDLNRISLARRMGLLAVMKRRRWGFTIAGSSVRYRHRVRPFERFSMRAHCVGRDARFFYLEQSMIRKGKATSNALFRAAVIDRNGAVPTQDVAVEMAEPDWNPVLPGWVQNWIDAENSRPWPPAL